MDSVITGIVDHTVVPMGTAIGWMASSGVLLLIFAGLWVAFAAGLIFSQGSLDQAWLWIRSLPILLQAVVWLLFLPVVGGLWVWETTWPLLLRLVVVAGLGAWNILVFLPRATPAP
jgi:hypothetical protein